MGNLGLTKKLPQRSRVLFWIGAKFEESNWINSGYNRNYPEQRIFRENTVLDKTKISPQNSPRNKIEDPYTNWYIPGWRNRFEDKHLGLIRKLTGGPSNRTGHIN